mgnify:CR=1 FL=1
MVVAIMARLLLLMYQFGSYRKAVSINKNIGKRGRKIWVQLC